VLKSFNCPVCKQDKWHVIETYLYSKADNTRPYKGSSLLLRTAGFLMRVLVSAKPRSRIVKCDSLTPYQKLRRDVIFNVWFKNKKEVEISSIYCGTCGFTCYTPRPDDDDVAEKYIYLKKYERSKAGRRDGYDTVLEKKRAERIYGLCSKYATDKNLNILDYGGAGGKLLLPFKNGNHHCFVIDYDDSTISGVTKLGNDIHDAVIDKKFDLIICSHVLEHVSDLAGLVNKLKDYLEEDGIIYAEVPQQIWAGITIEADPVTHINYFTLNSFLNLFLANGFEVLESKQTLSNYGSSFMEVIWIVAGKNPKKPTGLLPADTGAMLYPSRLYSAKKLLGLLSKYAFARIAKSSK
jgi:SAM-dependent methyltransferase